MTTSLLDRLPVSPPAGPGVTGLVAEAEASLAGAGGASVDGLDDEALGEVIAGLARVESRAVELRLALSAEADRRRVAEATAETGTDAWLARLTGTSRAQAAGGLRLARLLGEKYAATREAFAAGRVGVDQVRVILSAAEQAPAEATPGQLRLAEQWLVDQATGAGTRTGRSLDAKRLRQAARRMFARIDPSSRPGTRRSCSAARPAAPRPRPSWPCTTTATGPTPAGSGSPSSTATSSPRCWTGSPHPAA